MTARWDRLPPNARVAEAQPKAKRSRGAGPRDVGRTMIAFETVDRWPDWAWGMLLSVRARRRARRHAGGQFAEWQDHGEPVG